MDGLTPVHDDPKHLSSQAFPVLESHQVQTTRLSSDDGHPSNNTARAERPLPLLPPVATTSSKMNSVLSTADDEFFMTDTDTKLESSHYVRHPRSSHLERWIHEQQSQPSTPTTPSLDMSLVMESVGTPCNPYLAYPQLSRIIETPPTPEEGRSVESYDLLLDDDDIPESPSATPITLSPFPTPSPRVRKNSLTPSTPNSPLSVRSTSPTGLLAPTGPSIGTATPPPKSFFQRSSRPATPQTHGRSSSLSTIGLSALGISNRSPEPSTSTSEPKSKLSTWRWRPSVLGHLSSLSVPHVHVSDALSPPRPSTSSMTTHTTTSGILSANNNSADADKLSLVSSVRSRAFSPFKPSDVVSTIQSPAHSVWSLPMHQLQVGSSSGEGDASMSTPTLPRKQGSTIRLPFASHRRGTHARHEVTRSDGLLATAEIQVAYSSHPTRNTLRRVSFSSAKKKKLVVNGIAAHDIARFEALKRWCESFGEVSQITRMPDGELHVHFKKAEVADTVCRVRAKVYIAEVGSVFLSWYTGNRP